jgi:hypothetical protein
VAGSEHATAFVANDCSGSRLAAIHTQKKLHADEQPDCSAAWKTRKAAKAGKLPAQTALEDWTESKKGGEEGLALFGWRDFYAEVVLDGTEA